MSGAVIALTLLFFYLFPVITKVLFRDLRIPRILHYVALAGLGISLYSANQPAGFQTALIPTYLLFIVTLTYAAVFAIVTNNIADLEADRFSNPDRPLVTGSAEQKSYLRAGIVCQAVAMLVAISASPAMFWGIMGISAGYFVYSCPPLRLKRIPLLAKLLIGFNSLSVAVTGFVLAGGYWLDFPFSWVLFIMIPLSLSANFVDLKDTEGDGKTGVKTLPVLFGEKKARLFIVICTAATYATGGILLNIGWVYPLMALLLTLHIWLLYQKPYDEKPVFMVYLTALFGLDIFLFFG